MLHHWHLGLPGLPWGLDKHPCGAQGIHHSSLIDTHYSCNATHCPSLELVVNSNSSLTFYGGISQDLGELNGERWKLWGHQRGPFALEV